VPVATPGAATPCTSAAGKSVARHAVGNRPVPQLCDSTDWDHLAGRVADLQAGNVLRRPPELAVGLDDDLGGLAEIGGLLLVGVDRIPKWMQFMPSAHT